MKKFFIVFGIFILLFAGFFLFKMINNKTSTPNYQVSRTSINEQIFNQNTTPPEPKTYLPPEEELSEYSTDLVQRYTNSKNNISVCCSILDGTIVDSGETFSFWGTLGDTTNDKGYVAADSFDEDGDTVQTYGGGVCQVSSTLYNAVLALPDYLTIVERHPHSKPVNYVEEGKDATVSYPSVDFRFANEANFPIKISAEY